MSSYKTIAYKSTSLYKEKGSKFFGYAFPINHKEEVKQLLAQIQEEHPKARHVCTGLLLGTGNDEYFLTNDDGEPTNSAGAPILGQIRSFGVTNTFIAVVRYFGGTKLGVGGLIQAYKSAAADALEANQIVEKEPQAKLMVKVSYPELGNILSIVDKNNLEVEVSNESAHSILIIHCNLKDLEQVESFFERSQASIERV